MCVCYILLTMICFVFLFKQKTAYEMRISDWSSDVCSSDLTLLHGDTHLGNIYLLPDGRAGLLDWQLVVRGHHMHDVNYIVTTALSIGDRRNHERDLLAYYLDRLKAHGVAAAPDLEESWTEYKRRSDEHTSETQSLMRI